MDLQPLFSTIQPPAPFAENTHAFWDDAHISKQMLAAHLDPEFEGASRNPGFIEASVNWIAGLVPPAQFPCLWDFGCGPGLYATRLAQKGYTVTGLDLSRRSIAYAKEQAQQNDLAITYHVQNYLAMADENVCDAAIMIYCDYGALSPQHRSTLLQNVHRALAPGGVFVLDVFTQNKLDAFCEQRVWSAHPKGGFWSAAPYMALHDNRKYPRRLSLEQTTLVKEDGLFTFYIWNQYFTAGTLAAEAEAAGFAVLQTAGNAAGTPPTENSETLAMVLQKA